MLDGHLNKCKDCTKKDVSDRESRLRQNPDWVEKERERGRSKYHRLNYVNNSVDPGKKKKYARKYYARFPEKRASRNKVSHLRTKLNVADGVEMHHWSYRKEHVKDVILLPAEDHHIAHRYLVYDKEEKMYRTKDGVLLDTNLGHWNYIKSVIEVEKLATA